MPSIAWDDALFCDARADLTGLGTLDQALVVFIGIPSRPRSGFGTAAPDC